MDPITSRLASPQTSLYQSECLKDGHVQRIVLHMFELISSSFGAGGAIKTVQNQCGGHVTVSSVSSRLFSAMSISNPVLRIVMSAVQGHLIKYSDGGLFCSLLALRLILSRSELNIPNQISTHIQDCLLKICTDYLNSVHCRSKQILENCDLKTLLTLVRSVVSTKSVCALHGEHLDFVTRLIVEAFLKSVSVKSENPIPTNNVIFHFEEGFPVTECRLFEGVMLDLHGVPQRAVSKLRDLKKSEKSVLTVALINVSMSGDDDDANSEMHEISDHVESDSVFVSRLSEGVHKLTSENGVDILFCQKVVHPAVKRRLFQKDVIVLDRLGKERFEHVHSLTGGGILSAIHTELTFSKEDFGQLKQISVQIVPSGTPYLLIKGLTDCVVTLLICHPLYEGGQELKAVCVAAIETLHLHIASPVVLFGAGCWQVHLAHYIRVKVKEDICDLLSKLRCTKIQLIQMTETFSHALEQTAMALCHDGSSQMTDGHDHHLWTVPKESSASISQSPSSCACGYLKRENVTELIPLVKSTTELCLNAMMESGLSECKSNDSDMKNSLTSMDTHVRIMDSFSVFCNALAVAVVTATSVSEITQYIWDRN